MSAANTPHWLAVCSSPLHNSYIRACHIWQHAVAHMPSILKHLVSSPTFALSLSSQLCGWLLQVLIVGDSGLGKTTLVKTLLSTPGERLQVGPSTRH